MTTEPRVSDVLRERIEYLASRVLDRDGDDPTPARDERLLLIQHFLASLEAGEIRAAERLNDGRWQSVAWVKRGILAGFRVGVLEDQSPRDAAGRRIPPFTFIEKSTYPARTFMVEDNVRIVPGGTTARRGAHLAAGVVCMAPVFVNVGAFIDRDTMVDSHALVGSCAQIGARVHISAAAQIGGVLEPINAAPVIVEDDVLVGGNCGVYEGTVVRERAVLAAGVILTRGTPVFDLVRETVYRATATSPLEIPPGAVVVPGTRAVQGKWAREHGLAVASPLIVKYRDAGTDAVTALEAALR
jgi:2,3,4,5-tetrahydropyridine-2-carboxylate N-succinyltransferase